MERKLIKQGGGGYTVYLPKKWITENNLDKGDELNINISGKDLILSSKPSEKKSETEIKLTNLIESSIRTLITNTYRTGFDRIRVFFNNDKQFKILQEIIKKRLIGFEIIKKQKEFCIVENITEPGYDQFDNLLKKMFLNIEDLFLITKEKLENKKESEDYREVEERIMKYDNFCRRVISKQKLIKKNSEMFWTFLVLVVHGQRELYHLNKILNKKIKFSKETIGIFENSYKIFKLIEKAYYEKKLELLGEVHEIEKIIERKISKILNKKSEENLIIHHLALCAREFYQANSPLSGIIM
ncbi:hypothetical protein GF386_05645 [Candidatus Pacearchaeota archaeon]|nr:hypothetical protein [Candidatus Pacearchaeota archaeon]MBD3283578.1 hypothetical protein [Candidatus Pacearchaeota archaeon]